MLCPKFFQRLIFIIDGFIAYKSLLLATLVLRDFIVG